MANWALLESLPEGPLREGLGKVREDLEQILKMNGVLVTLADLEWRRAEIHPKAISVSVNTILSLGAEIETQVDRVFHHLNEIYESHPPRAGGAA